MELFDLDAKTGELTRKFAPCNRIKAGATAGSDDGRGYLQLHVDGRLQKAHRIVFLMTHGYLPPRVDHINGIRSDNRPENLRAATAAENAHNAKKPRHNGSGFKGVSWHKGTGKWRAQVRFSGKCIHLGYYENQELAAVAATEGRKKFHGQFAKHD